MEEARAISYLGGRSAANTNSFISQDDGYSGVGSEQDLPNFGGIEVLVYGDKNQNNKNKKSCC